MTDDLNNAEQLPKLTDTTKRDVLQIEKQITAVTEKLPEIKKSITELPDKQNNNRITADGLRGKINKLNEQIAIARDIASRIKVGVKFSPNSTLELRNPSNIADLSTSTYISGYFKTAKKDGLIFYLGNPEGTNLRKTKTVSIYTCNVKMQFANIYYFRTILWRWK